MPIRSNSSHCVLDLHMPRFQLHALNCLLLISLLFQSCDTIDLYEKTTAVPRHEWRSNFKPAFDFTINDTTSPYQVYVILRHNDRYNFNNIWINLYTKAPNDTVQKVQLELPLAEKEKGWLGSAMGDVFEHRIAITPPSQPLYFTHKGNYTFTIEQVMREDPLREVMDVGLRIEKKPQ
jgi:gliding motility-associated lipoprotein GldH